MSRFTVLRFIVAAMVPLLIVLHTPVALALTERPQNAGSPAANVRGEFSVPALDGKGTGSGQWGYAGEIETYNGTDTYTYGLGFDPTDGSLVVSDSGKVLFSTFGCALIGGSSPCQLGTPRVFDYSVVASDKAGVNEGAYTQYGGNGTWNPDSTDSDDDAANAGLGLRYQDLADRNTYVFSDDPAHHGPRGVVVDKTGTAWVTDYDAIGGAYNAANPPEPVKVKRFNQNLEITGASGWAGTSATRKILGVNMTDAGVDIMADGNVIINSEGTYRLNIFDPSTGEPVRQIYLADDPSDPDILKFPDAYSVAADPVDGSLYIPLANFGTDSSLAQQKPWLEKRDADGTVLKRFYAPDTYTDSATGTSVDADGLQFGQTIMSAAVEPRTQHVFAWSQAGDVQEWDKDGNYIREYTLAQFPGLETPRDVAFDANGRMYISVKEGTDSTRVMILGKTPSAPTDFATQCAPGTNQVTFTWKNASRQYELDNGGQAPYQESSVLDFVFEKRLKATASADAGPWEVIAHTPDPNLSRTIDFGDQDPNLYELRVTAWNESGNSDATVLSDVCPPCAGNCHSYDHEDRPNDGVHDRPDDGLDHSADDGVHDRPDDGLDHSADDGLDHRADDGVHDRADDGVHDRADDGVHDGVHDRADDGVHDRADDGVHDRPNDGVHDRPDDRDRYVHRDCHDDGVDHRPDDGVHDGPDDGVHDGADDGIHDRPDHSPDDGPDHSPDDRD